MLAKIRTFLNQPYPDNEDFRSNLLSSLLAGFVVFTVLMLLLPFGLNGLPLKEAAVMNLIFGLITFIVSILFDFFLKYILKLKREQETWTLWKWCLSVIALVSIIALANYAFLKSYFSPDIAGFSFFGMLYSTFVVAVFPIIFFGSLNMIRQLNKNRSVALNFSSEKDTSKNYKKIDLPIKDSGKTLLIDPNKILYVEAMQNYVNIVSNSEGEIIKQLHRNTLTNVARAFADTAIKQSHRSYLVNTERISSVSGNAQGLKLKFSGLDDAYIPVSRKYIPYFKNASS